MGRGLPVGPSGLPSPEIQEYNYRSLVFRDVAQSGSALQWGCRGRGFKSRRPD